MFMRYQWGYAVGHAYAYSSSLLSCLTPAGFLEVHLKGLGDDAQPPSLSSATPDDELRENVRDRTLWLVSVS
jgi:hypothetical protein